MTEDLEYMKGCEVCNIGLIKEVDRLVSTGQKLNEACRTISGIVEKKFGMELYTEAALRNRYLLNSGRKPDSRREVKKPICSPRAKSPSDFEEETKPEKPPQKPSMFEEAFKRQEKKKLDVTDAYVFLELNPVSEDVLDLVYKFHAKTMHPDVGGSDEEMQQLNEYVKLLKENIK